MSKATKKTASSIRASKALRQKHSKTNNVEIPKDVEEVVLVQPEVVSSSVEEEVKTDFPVPETSSRKALDKEGLRIEFEQFNNLLRAEYELSRNDKGRKVTLQTWKKLQKELNKLKAISLKSAKKKTRNNTNTQSGFNKPVKISDKLAQFTGIEPDALVSRLDITKEICKYIKENGLQNPEDKRVIKPDAKLADLLGYDPEKDEKLTYFYLQKKMQPHFQKIGV